LVPIVALLAASPALAQNGLETFLGVLGGATVGDMSGGGISTDSRWGGTAGLFVGLRTNWYSVGSIEVSWIQKGGERTRLDYIEVPVLAGATIPAMTGSLRFRGYVGIAPAFKIGCRSDTVLLDCDDVKNTEWSLPLGFMVLTRLGRGQFIGLDLRYSLGLSDVFENAELGNRSLQFRGLIGMPLGRS